MRRSIMSLSLAALMLLIWPATALAATPAEAGNRYELRGSGRRGDHELRCNDDHG